MSAERAVQSEEPEIPDKLYFRIGEVSRLVGVKPHVLRYWETEFPNLSPKKSGSGQRLYRRKDVGLLLEIRRLLHDQRFTIQGARRKLAGRGKQEPPKPAPQPRQTSLFEEPPVHPAIDTIRKQLRDILKLLG